MIDSEAPDTADALDALARDALGEVTSPASIGPEIGRAEHDGVVDIEYLSEVPGYSGWHWTVTLAQVDEAEPTVVELAMLPGDGALLAPAWVPWAERLAEYRRTHGAAGPDGDDLDDADDVDDDTDDDDTDDDDADEDDADDLDDDEDEDEEEEDDEDDDPLDRDVDETDLDDFDDEIDIDDSALTVDDDTGAGDDTADRDE